MKSLQSDLPDDHPGIDPRCWSNAKRRQAAICMGLLAFLEPFASSVVAPSLDTIAVEFQVSSPVLRNVRAHIHRGIAYKC